MMTSPVNPIIYPSPTRSNPRPSMEYIDKFVKERPPDPPDDDGGDDAEVAAPEAAAPAAGSASRSAAPGA